MGLRPSNMHLRATGVIRRDSSRRVGPGLGGLRGSRGRRTPSENGPVGQGPQPDLEKTTIGSQAVTFDRYCKKCNFAREKRHVNQLWCGRSSTAPYLAVPVSACRGLFDQEERLRHVSVPHCQAPRDPPSSTTGPSVQFPHPPSPTALLGPSILF